MHEIEFDCSNLQVDATVSARCDSHEPIFTPVSAPAVFDEPAAIKIPSVEQYCMVEVAHVRGVRRGAARKYSGVIVAPGTISIDSNQQRALPYE